MEEKKKKLEIWERNDDVLRIIRRKRDKEVEEEDEEDEEVITEELKWRYENITNSSEIL